ncbi:MAG: PAS domain S-box protein [Pedosphaera sp.]|nr:PAS domain S-box protein [Pedosphaera sp.]
MRLGIELVALVVVALGVHLVWRRWHRLVQSDSEYLRHRLAALDAANRQALRDELAGQKAILDGMADRLAVLDSVKRVKFVNLALRQWLGINSDARGRTVLELLRQPELVYVLGQVDVHGRATSDEFELHSGSGKHVKIEAAQTRGADGRPAGILLVFRDVTRLKQLENTRREFVANVSHELCTPLSLITGYVETLLDDPPNSPNQARKFLEKVQRHASRLTFLIEDLLTLTSLDTGKHPLLCETVELRTFVDELCEDFKDRAATKHLTLRNEMPEGLDVDADSARFGQVFSNLLDNAIKYGRDAGNVRVGGRRLPGGETELWVADDGTGIRESDRERVFERFYRVDRARSRESGGTGLGLSIVKHIVQLHGGEVGVESEIGVGSRFYFTLPALITAGPNEE